MTSCAKEDLARGKWGTRAAHSRVLIYVYGDNGADRLSESMFNYAAIVR